MDEFEKQKIKFFSWIDKVGEKEKIGVISHAKCLDGMASMIFFLEIIKKLRPYAPEPEIYFMNYGLGNFDLIVDQFKKRNVQKIFLKKALNF